MEVSSTLKKGSLIFGAEVRGGSWGWEGAIHIREEETFIHSFNMY